MRFIYFKYLLIVFLPSVIFAQTFQKNLNIEHWQFHKTSEMQWYSATVPGTVHTDLYNNKIIPDPFFADNEKKLQWIENEDWEYQTTFDISQEELNQQHIELQFDGLDTYANVYLNDSLLFSADNMFRTWNVEIKNKIHLGENKLKIVFQSAVKKGKEEAKKLNYTLPGDEKIFTRKAQYQYGWDFGPRFVTCGIYKDVKLIFWNNAKMLNVKCNLKSLTDEKAELEFVCEIKSEEAIDYNLNTICNTSKKTSDILKQKIQLRKGRNICTINYSLLKPNRWWSNGLGESFLYLFTIQLANDKNIIDKKELNIGLRTLELVQEKDSIGQSFYFKLNGIPVFMKGANYIPPDNFLPRVTKNDYEKIVQNAVDANMNMLRVWGGGVYADDSFYEACDKKGILVWQDFMFACAMYPTDEHFINNVSEEIKEQIQRLQNHPSLALWCGNNEIDEGWKNWGWQKQYNYSVQDSTKIWNDYVFLFQKNIPTIISKLSPSLLGRDEGRGYIPSSPSIGWGHKESLQQGDSHYWGVWWGMEPFENYKNKVGRFMSEYGFQGIPSLNSLKKFTNENDLNFNSDAIKNHQKHPTGFQTINTYMERDYIVPKDFEKYIYVSQLLQAEGMKTAIEAHRRAKPNCMGTLFWQLNDCWPGITWSSIDYYGNPKAMYYQAKRSYEPIIISINEENNQYKIYILNDELKNKNGKLDLKLIDFNGKILWSKTLDISINSNTSAIYYSIDKKEFSTFNLKQIVLNVSLKLNENEIKTANYYFAKPKDLQLIKPTITITPIDSSRFEISSNVLAKDVFINFDDGKLNDNYFDLLPNEKRIVELINQTKFEKNIAKIISLFDSK